MLDSTTNWEYIDQLPTTLQPHHIASLILDFYLRYWFGLRTGFRFGLHDSFPHLGLLDVDYQVRLGNLSSLRTHLLQLTDFVLLNLNSKG